MNIMKKINLTRFFTLSLVLLGLFGQASQVGAALPVPESGMKITFKAVVKTTVDAKHIPSVSVKDTDAMSLNTLVGKYVDAYVDFAYKAKSEGDFVLIPLMSHFYGVDAKWVDNAWVNGLVSITTLLQEQDTPCLNELNRNHPNLPLEVKKAYWMKYGSPIMDADGLDELNRNDLNEFLEQLATAGKIPTFKPADVVGSPTVVAKLAKLATMPKYVQVFVAKAYAKATQGKGALIPNIEKTSGYKVTLADLAAAGDPLSAIVLDDRGTTIKIEGSLIGVINDGELNNVAITTLIIRNCKSLKTITANAFASLSNLTKVVIDGTAIETLPAGLFANNPKLTEIFIINNKKLTTLPADFFRGQENRIAAINLVDLSGNALTAEGLPNMGGMKIVQLRLSNNALKTLKIETVTNAAKISPLGELWLNGNRLAFENTTLIETLKRLRNLKYLQLADNKFTSSALSDLASCGLSQLTYLSLADNEKITQLFSPMPIVARQPRVDDIYNLYSSRSVVDTELVALRALDMSGCGIVALNSGDLKIVSNIELLDLRCNRIELLGDATTPGDSALFGAKNLKILHLGGNKLKTLTRESFGKQGKSLAKLKELYLEGNEITSIGANAFSDLVALETLIMFGNNHDFSWDQTKSGALLALAGNALENATSLKYADFSYNNIGILHNGWLNGLKSLEELSLAHNRLISLPENTFSGASKLRRVDLYGNKIATLNPFALNGLPRKCGDIFCGGNKAFMLRKWYSLWMYRHSPSLSGGCAAKFDITTMRPYAKDEEKVYKRHLARNTFAKIDEFHGQSLATYTDVYKERHNRYVAQIIGGDMKMNSLPNLRKVFLSIIATNRMKKK